MRTKEDLKPDKGTIIRTAILGITWLNMILANYDLQPIPVLDNESMAIIFAGVATVWAWFRNNYLTLKGKQQKKVLHEKGLAKK